jgi:membrane protein DedA with SNARE-associated domain
MLLYTLGKRGGSPVLRARFSAANVERAESLFARYGILTVVIPSLLPPPCPFKIFVLGAGVFRLKTIRFAIAVTLGRTIRYSMWGILAVLYGNAVKLYMRENLGTVGLALFGAFLTLIAATMAYYKLSAKRSKMGDRTA